MAIPNFNEILNEARAYQKGKAEQVASERSAGLMASGLSGFASSLINAPVGPRKTYTGELTGEGFQPYERPRETGGTAGEMGMRKLFDRGAEPEAMGGVPLTRPEAAGFRMKQLLEGQKQTGRRDLAVSREQAKSAARGQGKITNQNIQLNQWLSDYIYTRVGEDPTNKPRLTFGNAKILTDAYKLDLTSDLRSLGYEVSLEKDIFMGEEKKKGLKEKIIGVLNKPRLKSKAIKWLKDRGQTTSDENVQAVIDTGKVN